ncbi:serine/threonine-protein kinase [Mangrovihabitans endophyticus]|uniref:non-specific serine/threonine protein kinase n=1 Tax=Mangrovihabitans endophyticus TaxID=1751298 RepID=A0A8J3BYZ7_9ACTN|nr:serine/threonine-protein kinase [Mangrovihabitans endophyticus]GGK91582.1 putative serine/threonine-protein kinase PknA [Mangrovihabitans endophyticus]
MRTLGGRYRLVHRIGVGGMSEVWQGHDEVLDRAVAVKIMSPAVESALEGMTGTELVRTEARSAARLAHPNVASVHDFGTAQSPGRDVPYIVMELVDGHTLNDHLNGGALDWQIGVRICAEVAAALAAAHAEHVVHRDIKPANIMLTPAGAKVLDFGIAAAVGTPDPDPEGPVMGTPAYVAPERFEGLPATPATDMFALGVLLYHCLTGRLPWHADTQTGLVEAQRYADPDPLPPIEGLAPEVIDLCSRCLDRDPLERPTALVAALLLAESVDARVYVPLVNPTLAAARPQTRSTWDQRAAEAPTDAALPAGGAPEPVSPGASGREPGATGHGPADLGADERSSAERVGRHRAG